MNNKKNSKKRLVLLVTVMALVLALSLGMFVACNDDTSTGEKDPIEATEGLLISNSDFKVLSTSTTNYPRAITDWSGSKMYSSGSYESDIVGGAVNLDRKNYNDNKKRWNDKGNELYNLLTKDGRYGKDDEIKNALMVYMPEKGTDLGVKNAKYGPTAYGYTSKSFTVDKQSYYKFSVDVLTYNLKGTVDKDDKPNNEDEIGARIYLSSNTYQEYSAINTNGEWKTYTFFIEGNATASSTLTIMLGLGKYTTYYTSGLTTGYAFFDNLNLEKIEADKDGETVNKTPEQKYNDAKALELEQQALLDAADDEGNASADPDAPIATETVDAFKNGFVKTTSLRVPNGRFDFGSTTISSSAAPFNWSVMTGNSSEDDPAPTSQGYNGVINVGNFADSYKKYGGTFYDKNGSSVYPTDRISNLDLTAFGTDRIGKNVYMLSQQLMTAQGIKSSKQITFERGKSYALSIDVYTTQIAGAGLTLKLTGSDGKDIYIEGISKTFIQKTGVVDGGIGDNSPLYEGTGGGSGLGTTGGWTTYTFYIKGNQYKNYSYNMELWLGTGGTNDNTAIKYTKFTSSSSTPTENGATTYQGNGTFSTGWVFFDELNLTEIAGTDSESAADATLTDKGWVYNASNGGTATKIDLTSDNMFGTKGNTGIGITGDFSSAKKSTGNDPNFAFKDYEFGTGTPAGFQTYMDTTDKTLPVIDPGYVKSGVIDLKSDIANGALSDINVKDPGKPYEGAPDNLFMTYLGKDTAFNSETKTFEVLPNTFYRLSLWVKTSDIKSTSGIDVALMNAGDTFNKENGFAGTKDDRTDDVSLASFSKINTKDFDEYTNDWCEVTIVIRGHVNETKNVYLKFNFGSGNREATSTLAKGAAFVANMNLETITYKNFSDTSSGTYVKSVNLTTSTTGNFSNGNFEQFDLQETKLNADGLLEKASNAGVPSNWSISDNKIIDSDNENYNPDLTAGIIRMNADKGTEETGIKYSKSEQIHNVFGGALDDDFDKLYDGLFENKNYDAIGGPSMLTVGGKNNGKFAVGYASDSFTLSSQTTYKISVYVRSFNGAKGMIYLSGETTGAVDGDEVSTPYFTIGGENAWTKYTFDIKVGLSSVSLKLNLWLGYNVEVDTNLADGETVDKESGNVLSGGVILFDSVDYKTTKETEYNEAVNGDTSRKLSFLNESFDMLSASTEDKSKLTTPSGWTGNADTEQDKADSNAGAIFVDDKFLETSKGDENGYINILGKDADREEISDNTTTEQLKNYYEAHKADYDNKPFEEVQDKVVEDYINEQVKILQRETWMPIDVLEKSGVHSGNSMLIINNVKDSAYYFSGPSYTLKSDSYYSISVWVRTYFGLDENGYPINAAGKSVNSQDDGNIDAKNRGAYIELYLGSANESGRPLIFKAIDTTNKTFVPNQTDTRTLDQVSNWTQYTFYVATRNDDVTSVKLKLALGKYYSDEAKNALTSGYAMFDDVVINKITENVFTDIKKDIEANPGNHTNDILRQVSKDSTTGDNTADDEGTTTVPKNQFNLEYLWWMIPTIILGLLTIAAVIVFIVRKIKLPKKAGSIESTDQPSDAIDEKHDRYDSYNE